MGAVGNFLLSMKQKEGLKMKKLCSLILTVVMMFSLSACVGHSEEKHEYGPNDSQENTGKMASTPIEEVPSVETHNHDWEEATCTVAKSCKTCGMTEGSSNGHDWQEGVCTICGEIKPSDGLQYELSFDEQSYTVIGYGTCTDNEVVIPSTYEGKPVYAIADYAFQNCFSITKVTFSPGIQIIGRWSFENCIALSNVVLPSSLMYSGVGAFENCEKLQTVDYWGSIEDWCNIQFSPGDCSNPCLPGYASLYINGFLVETLEIPSSVTKISDAAFSGVGSINRVIIGDNVTIGTYAFWACHNLENVVIGENAVLGDGAFYYCPSLKKVVIKEGLTMIPDDSLRVEKRLAEVYLPKSLAFIEMYSLDAQQIYYAGSKDEWDNIVIQEGNLYDSVQYDYIY